VWLFESVLMRVQNTKKPQRKFLCHVMRVLLLLPGHVTFRNLSRYSPYHEKTFARWFARDWDVVSLNRAAIVEVVPPHNEHILAFDPSLVSKSGTYTYGLDLFGNGAHSRAEKGLEIATLAWVDVSHHSASALRVEQTPPAPTPATEETRIDSSLAQMKHVVTTQPLAGLTYLAGDGYCSKKKVVDGISALGLHVVGTLRRDANLRHLYAGPPRASRGRPKTYDGKVNVNTLARFEPVESDDAEIARYYQGVNPVQVKRHVGVVVVRHRPTQRYALLCSTAVALPATTLSRYYKARFQIACLFRDAKQVTGLSACQARSAQKWRFHCNASLRAVSFAKLEARQTTGKPATPFSMASLKRRCVNQHLVDRILDHVATEGSLEKSSAVYEELCNYGTIDDLAA